MNRVELLATVTHPAFAAYCWKDVTQPMPANVTADVRQAVLNQDDAMHTLVGLVSWRPIAEAPEGVELLLYFPPDAKVPAMHKVDRLPVHYPRQPTHFKPLGDDPC